MEKHGARCPEKWDVEDQGFWESTGKKIANAKFIRVELNGKILHANVEMKKATPAGVTGKEKAKGPIMFQGDHGPVAYRNIKITERP